MARSHVTNKQDPAAAHADGSGLGDVAHAAFLNAPPGDGYQTNGVCWPSDAAFAEAAVAAAPVLASEGAGLHPALKPETVALVNGEDLPTAMTERDGKTTALAEEGPDPRSDLADGGLLADPAEPTGEVVADAASDLVEPPPFRFYFDGVSDKEIAGWILRTDRPSRRCLVTLQEGDRVLARAVASRFRPDLAMAGIGDGCCAFSIPTRGRIIELYSVSTVAARYCERLRALF